MTALAIVKSTTWSGRAANVANFAMSLLTVSAILLPGSLAMSALGDPGKAKEERGAPR